jgi:hypothetical protein
MSTAYQANSTDVTTYWLALVASTGLPDTAGVAHNATGLTLHYNRIRESEATAVTGGSPAPQTLGADNSAHTDWGFRHIGNGVHRVDWPDAAFAAGSLGVILHVGGVSDRTFVLLPMVDLTGSDPRAAAVDSATIASAVVAAEVAALDGFTRGGTNNNGTLTLDGTTFNIGTSAAAETITSISAV